MTVKWNIGELTATARNLATTHYANKKDRSPVVNGTGKLLSI
ncbi:MULTISPECIES: hypothetical protein [Lysinibacillus]|nr:MULTISPECIES: hypothetical protein [Lysinibacillus]